MRLVRPILGARTRRGPAGRRAWERRSDRRQEFARGPDAGAPCRAATPPRVIGAVDTASETGASSGNRTLTTSATTGRRIQRLSREKNVIAAPRQITG